MEPFNKNKTILDKDTVSNTLTTSLKNTLTKQKKPVRFTWKGAADLFATMSNTPLRNVNLRSLMDKSLPRVTDLAEGRDKPKEKDYIDFFEDMEKSIFGAAQNIGYSIGDLLTTGTDLALDTNQQKSVGQTLRILPYFQKQNLVRQKIKKLSFLPKPDEFPSKVGLH